MPSLEQVRPELAYWNPRPGIDMEQITIGLIGLGTVGTGVARLLTEHGGRIARRAGKAIRWKWAVVRDPDRRREVSLQGVQVTTDVNRLIADPEVGVVIETMGGIEPALRPPPAASIWSGARRCSPRARA